MARGELSQLVERTNLLFAPCWSTSRNVLAFNRCILEAAGQSRGPESLLTDLNREGGTRAPAEVDQLVLAKAAKKLQTMIGGGRASPLLVPVKYRTISDGASLRTYVKLIQAIQETVRRLLALQIVEIPADRPASSILEDIQNLVPWVKWISLSFDLNDRRIPACAKAPVWALAVDLAGARSTDGMIHSQLRRLQVLAAAAQMNTFAHGVSSIGLALAGVKAGITYMDGSAIHPLANDPRPLGPLKPMLSNRLSSR